MSEVLPFDYGGPYGSHFFDSEPTVASTGATEPLTADAAKALTGRIRGCLERAYILLYEAHQRRAWVALGYATFADYVAGEFQMSRSRAYQLLDQARVVREISAAASTSVDIPEAAARELKPYLPVVTEQIRARVAVVDPEKAPEIVEEVIRESRLALEQRREIEEWDRKRKEERKEKRKRKAAKRREEAEREPEPDPPKPAPTDDVDCDLLNVAEWVIERPLVQRPREHVEALADWLHHTRQALTDMEADVRVALADDELRRL